MISGTFFEQWSCLSLRQWIVLLYWWAREYVYPVTDAAQEAEVDEKTAIGLPILLGHLQLETVQQGCPIDVRRSRSGCAD